MRGDIKLCYKPKYVTTDIRGTFGSYLEGLLQWHHLERCDYNAVCY